MRGLITFAYFAQPYAVVDGPEWIDRDHFDVVAVAQGRSVRTTVRCARRCARSNGTLGPGLRPSTRTVNNALRQTDHRARSGRAASSWSPRGPSSRSWS